MRGRAEIRLLTHHAQTQSMILVQHHGGGSTTKPSTTEWVWDYAIPFMLLVQLKTFGKAITLTSASGLLPVT